MLNKFNNSILIKNTFIYIFAEFISKMVPFMMLPILTVYLTPSDYGVVATYMAYTGVLLVFIHLSLVGAVRVNFFRFSSDDLKYYNANVVTVVFVSMLMVMGLVFLLEEQLSLFLELPKVWLYVGIFITAFQFFIVLRLGLWQVEHRAKSFGLFQVIYTTSSMFIILILVVKYNLGWEGQLIGQSVVLLFFSILSLILIIGQGYIKFDRKKNYFKEILGFGIPLIPHALSGWFRFGVDRILLTSFIGSSATGVYFVGYQLGMVVGLVAMAFNQAFSPYLYKKLDDIVFSDKLRLVKFTYLYFVAILVFAYLVSLIMSWVVVNFLDEKYIEATQYIFWIALGYAFQGMYFMVVNYIFYEKRTLMLSLITFVSGVIHTVLSYKLLSTYGAIGVAYATTISFFIMFVSVWWLSAKTYSMPWKLNTNDI